MQSEFSYICKNFLSLSFEAKYQAKYLFCIRKSGPVAQWIEQQPSKLWVTRSNRVGVTVFSFFYLPIFFNFFIVRKINNDGHSNGRKLEEGFKK